MQVQSFAPHVLGHERILILGSMPGVASLQQQQYYAHPRNIFWRLMAELFTVDETMPYSQRLRAIGEQGLALWDVYQQCFRPGSLDSAIDKRQASFNQIAELMQTQPSIRYIACNGQAAFKAMQRYLKLHHTELTETSFELFCLPSTSPANASMSYQQKFNAWQLLRELLEES